MCFMNLKSYVLPNLFICSYCEKKNCFFILFYFIFQLYDLWFIDCENKERDVDICFGEKYTYKSWFAYIFIVYMIIS